MSDTPRKISAIDITDLWYGSESLVTAPLTPTLTKTLVASLTKLENIHQDTWTYEEGEASQEIYRNQLTGQMYREGRKINGDESVKFTIGQYDFKVKQEFLGGNLIKSGTGENAEVVGWEKDDVVNLHKVIVFRTVDNVIGIFTNASIVANHANTDKAIGLAVMGKAMESKVSGVKSVYWFYGEKVNLDDTPAS